MAIRNIVKDGDEILTKVCRPVEKFDEKLGVLLDDMIETMKSADGVGLQRHRHPPPRRGDRCGERPHRNGKSGDRGAERRAGMRRRVPVLPGQYGITKRPMRVLVRAQNREGKTFELEGEELLATACCHEIDHLNGVVFKSHVLRMLSPEELQKLQ